MRARGARKQLQTNARVGTSPSCSDSACSSTSSIASIFPSRTMRCATPSTSTKSPSAISQAHITGPTRSASCRSARCWMPLASRRRPHQLFALGTRHLSAPPSRPPIGTLFASRMLLGIGESPIFPANAKAIGLWFPPEERGLAHCHLRRSRKVLHRHRRPAHRHRAARRRMAHALRRHCRRQPALLRHLLLPLSRPAARPSASATPPIPAHAPVPFRYLLRQRKIYGLSIGFGAYNYVFYLLLTWLPTYLSAALHIDLLHSFLYTGFPGSLPRHRPVRRPARRLAHPSRLRRQPRPPGHPRSSAAFGLGIFGAAAAAHSPYGRSSGSASPSAAFPLPPPSVGRFPPHRPARQPGPSAVSSTSPTNSPLSPRPSSPATLAYTHSFARAFSIPHHLSLIADRGLHLPARPR